MNQLKDKNVRGNFKEKNLMERGKVASQIHMKKMKIYVLNGNNDKTKGIDSPINEIEYGLYVVVIIKVSLLFVRHFVIM